MARLYDAAMLVNRCSRHAVVTGHFGNAGVWIAKQCPDLAYLFCVQFRFATTGPASGTSCGQPGLSALPDQATLELSQRRKYMKNQLARRAARLDFFCQALKANASLFKVSDDLHKVRQTATKAIQAPYHQRIPSSQGFAALFKLWTHGALTAARFLVDHATPSLRKRIALQLQVLVIGRYASVPHPLIHGRNQYIEKLTDILTLNNGNSDQQTYLCKVFIKPPFSEHDGCNDTPPVRPRLVPNEK